MTRRLLRPASMAIGIALLSLSGLAGCSHQMIPNTEIEDTEENRSILAVINAYHVAFENRDADALMDLVAEDYYEDNGNTDRGDDYGKPQLYEALRRDFDSTEKVQLDIRVEDIQVDLEKKAAEAFIFYTIRARTEFPSGKQWKTSTDRSRLTFVEVGELEWKIISGL